ncbi:MAG: dipeptide/oligopeptide/nickel ABC transporter permease/ATP-binding protein [Caldilineales bacterium]|nr:dipeptide/oligopeptide/nickel ABC transporter permease/ATP-binding protein [Caldilineales bacterium]
MAAASILRSFDFLRSLSRNRMGMVGLILLAAVALMALFAPIVAPYDPYAPVKVTIDDIYAPPGPQHWLGTDDAGKDVLANFIYGSRVSLTVGFFAAFISIAIGGLIGVVAGFYGGRTENILMRFTDIMLVIPDLPLIVVIVALTKPSLANIILVIGILGWTSTARIVRSQTLSVKQRKFVVRARAVGAGNPHIIRRHILPLVTPLLVVNAVLVISLAVLNESALSFLGLSDPTRISWGQMLNYAFTRGAMSAGAWWALIPPGFGIVWVVLALTLLGQGLERVLNPRLDTHHLMPEKHMAAPAAARTRWRPELAQAPVILEVADLSIDYVTDKNPPMRAVEGVSLQLRQGELLGLVGESGCGKSTLVLGLLRLLPATGRISAGQIWFEAQNLVELDDRALDEVRWDEIAIIFQGAMNALNPVRTVGDQIAEAIRRHSPDLSGPAVAARVEELLALVGITPDRQTAYPHQYSGGMRQRAMIAMALACDPKIIIADEPTTALDVMIQAQILDLLADLRQKFGLSIIFITHDLGVVAELCDTVWVMYGGVVAEYAPVDAIYNHPQHPYTQELLKAFPDPTRPGQKLVSIPGSPPRLDALPPGCRFAPRCPVAFDRCHVEAPALHHAGEGQVARCHLLAEMPAF